jgi:predicted membrane chloride channel (bestrophin family)
MLKLLMRKYAIMLHAARAVAVVIALKVLAHWLGWEILSQNPLFSGIVAANVFLTGFLLSGVLSDYKESERLPGDVAASLEAIVDEAHALHETKKSPETQAFVNHMLLLALSIERWFYKKESTRAMLDKLTDLHRHFSAMEGLTQATFIARCKQEQSSIRRMLIRIHTIRETSFITSGYLIAYTTTLLLSTGLIMAKIEPFYESLFFVGVITFLLIYMILLIKDLDNPFGHYEGESSEDVSLKPIEDLIKRLKDLTAAA